LAPDPVSLLTLLFDRRVAEQVAACFLPLSIYILVSGLDDLFMDAAWWLRCWREGRARARAIPHVVSEAPAEEQIALFLPLWREAGVIEKMVDHNIAAIRYSNYQIFIGAYPNDPQTVEAIRRLEAKYARVHLALTPHEGPTSKADCLNWVFQRMLLHEEQQGFRFEIIAMHDAEDLIHPEEFRIFNRQLLTHDMVQMPVLPLPTPWWEFTHGLYCDDFAEGQGKDLVTRLELGGFMPGCGVGTAFRRDALEKLAEANANRIFEPGCLTEDYENGLRMYQIGCRQHFVPVEFERGVMVATREYFPRDADAAVRQRSRWITGNSLQTWERHGWGKSAAEFYFFWRDRKGLWGNPLSLACNLVLLYGLLSLGFAAMSGGPWWIGELLAADTATSILAWETFFLLLTRVASRIAIVSRFYGLPFGLLAPMRMLWGNWINTRATVKALWTYGNARLHGRPLKWVKTEHAYPSRSALVGYRRRLGEVLVQSDYISAAELEAALSTQPPGVRIGRHLVDLGLIREEELLQALSLQQSLPYVRLNSVSVSHKAVRTLPAAVIREWKVLPFRVEKGKLLVASCEIPSEEMQRSVQQFTGLEVLFHLASPPDLERAVAQAVKPAEQSIGGRAAAAGAD